VPAADPLAGGGLDAGGIGFGGMAGRISAEEFEVRPSFQMWTPELVEACPGGAGGGDCAGHKIAVVTPESFR
jgi:hypothetical protein